jgi:response regulator of citrate/malate metabolism
MDEDIRRSQEAGFVEHLIKPLDFASLEQAIGRVIARKKRETSPRYPSSSAS